MPTMSKLCEEVESATLHGGPMLTLSSCHQCRQRSFKITASCKNTKGDKPCHLKMCHRCLLNRYGEVVQTVSQLKDWKCPKCRGICNCSACMKKSGFMPTGQLKFKAKENGYPSVLELHYSRGANAKTEADQSLKSSINKKKRAGLTEISDSAANNVAITDKSNAKRPRTSKENSKDVKLKENKKRKRSVVDLSRDEKNKEESKMSENPKSKGFPKDNLKLKVVSSSTGETYENVSKEKSAQKSRDTKKFANKDVIELEDEGVNEKSKTKSSNGSRMKKLTTFFDGFSNSSSINKVGVMKTVGTVRSIASNPLKPHNLIIKTSQKKNKPSLPSGIPVNSISGIDLSPEDVGEALQFFEFCQVFGKMVLNLKKGQAEAIIRDILNNKRQLRSQSRFQNSVLSEAHKTLLKFIKRSKSEGDDASVDKQSWVQSLGDIVSEVKHVPKEFARENFDKGFKYYDGLKVSHKLRLLNMLCDEALNTTEIRKWINDQRALVLKKQKEEKDNVAEAKAKEREIGKRIQEFMKSGSKNAEYRNSLANLNNEAREARKSIAEAMNVISNDEKEHGFLRTDSVTDTNGRVFWRLRCCHGLSGVLLQDNKNVGLHEEAWFSYDAQHEDDVEKYVTWLKKRVANQVSVV